MSVMALKCPLSVVITQRPKHARALQDQGWQNAFHPSSADSHGPQVCFMLQVPLTDKFRSKFS